MRWTTSSDMLNQAPWVRFFWSGLLLWLASIIVTALTRNANLIPTIVLLGSFLVPATWVMWGLEHEERADIPLDRIVYAFAYGGIVGTLAASVLEAYFLGRHPIFGYFGVGLIEEACKLGVLWYVGRQAVRKTVSNGLILGATVGFGFAAFESSGYALNALFTPHGLSLADLVQTEALRGLLTPIGHGLWTAIVGGVLFGQSRNGHFRITGRLMSVYLFVSMLHGLWDSMQGIAIEITLIFTGRPWQLRWLEEGRVPQATLHQMNVFQAVTFAGMALITLMGLLALRRIHQQAIGAAQVGRSRDSESV
jgi:RsiW-degrading membrane proteinase PrsW (M82 family)